MADRNCRVTVVGAARRVDVAVPARAPIGEYVASLALLCGEELNDVMPAAWSLATTERGPLAVTSSLADGGIVDGQVLHLRDLAAGEYDEPGVFEVQEIVADTARQVGGLPWNAKARAAAVLLAGVAWLVTVVSGTPFTSARMSVGPLALATGLLLAMTAWVARSRRLAIAAAVRVLLALGAVPCLGLAGWFIAVSRWGAGLGPAIAGPAAGVLAGSVIALIAMPSAATFATALASAAAVTVTTALVLLHAGLAGSAAVVALTSYVVVILGPRAAVRVAATWALLTGQEDPQATVVAARRLLTAGTILACTCLSVALVLLGASPDPFAISLAAAVAVAILLHAPACAFVSEAGPAIVAGLSGLLSILLCATGHLDLPAWSASVAGAGLGVAALAAGLALSMSAASRAAGEPAWSRITASVCFIAAVPLAVGVFGVFGTLMGMGRHL
jgi:WXG100 protein secretion system (Wss), protein YukD